MAILLLCVNYKNDAQTTLFVKNVLALEDSNDIAITVVDNSSAAGSPSPLHSRLAGIEGLSVLEAPDNPGYMPGAARGLADYCHNHPTPDWVILSNTDIDFPDRSFFTKLKAMSCRCDRENIGIVAPRIRSVATGAQQNPFMDQRPSQFRTYLRLLVASSSVTYRLALWFARIRRKTFRGSREDNQPAAIFAPHGSFMIFHSRFFARGGDFNNGNALFGEETYAGELARLLGLRVLFEPSLEVNHREHASIEKIDQKKRHEYNLAAHRNISHVLSPTFGRSVRMRVKGGREKQ